MDSTKIARKIGGTAGLFCGIPYEIGEEIGEGVKDFHEEVVEPAVDGIKEAAGAVLDGASRAPKAILEGFMDIFD